MAEDSIDRLLERLKLLRQVRGLTQEEFAEKSGISYKYYQAVEAGRKRDLRISTIDRLAKAHGLEGWEMLLPAPSRKAAKKQPAAKKTAKKRSGH
ncbi:MAG: helix-turn-helix transcriptional regulator [Verrucomicrobiales bacterium]|jgi:transcriptional regulator with XRE-family HTH domain